MQVRTSNHNWVNSAGTALAVGFVAFVCSLAQAAPGEGPSLGTIGNPFSNSGPSPASPRNTHLDDLSTGDHPHIELGIGAVDMHVEGLVGVVFGLDFAGAGGELERRYFKVTSSLYLQPGDELGLPMIDTCNIQVVPISSPGAVGELHYFPADFRSESFIGVSGSVGMRAIGWQLEAEQSLSPHGGGALLRHLTAFIDLTLDLFGLRYTAYDSGARFTGLEMGSITLEAGFSWDLTRAATLRLAVGGSASAAHGHFLQSASSPPVSATPYQTDLYATLGAQLRALHGHLTALLYAERESYGILSRDPEVQSDEVADYRLSIGIRARF